MMSLLRDLGLAQALIMQRFPDHKAKIQTFPQRSTILINPRQRGRMVIYEVEGDILLSRAQVIAHGVAAQDPMNQGLAQALHENYPAMMKDYHHWCYQVRPKAGEAWMWGSADGLRIVNLLTQDASEGRSARPGKATTRNVNHALRALKKMADKEQFTSLALPRLATGVGGLDWADVHPLIDNQLGALSIPVYVYAVYRPGEKADEPEH